jgi:Protein of unknown function DUF262
MAKKPRRAEDAEELRQELLPLTFEDDPNVLDDAASEELETRAFAISSYGADYSVDMLVKRMRTSAFYVPDFQRAFVWNQRQASRFIESLLMGLPVPGIFMFKDPSSSKHLIVDGQQRLKTLQLFYDGTFRERKFRLLDVADGWDGCTYEELHEDDRQRLDDSIIHTTIFKQDQPRDDKSSVYEVFERINTGGVKLSAQEIRSCVNHGRLIALLRELNSNTTWRGIYGKPSDRLKDQELLLRFFAFSVEGPQYKRPMRRFLNKFLDENDNLPTTKEKAIRETFEATIAVISESLGHAAFRPEKQLNTAVFDSVMIGLSRRLANKKQKPTGAAIKKAYEKLLANDEFRAAYSRATADEEQVKSRLKLATDAFSAI